MISSKNVKATVASNNTSPLQDSPHILSFHHPEIQIKSNPEKNLTDSIIDLTISLLKLIIYIG